MNDNQPNNSNVNVMEEIINQVIANFNFNIMIDINIITYGIIKFIDDFTVSICISPFKLYISRFKNNRDNIIIQLP